jgi:hypothetical protein
MTTINNNNNNNKTTAPVAAPVTAPGTAPGVAALGVVPVIVARVVAAKDFHKDVNTQVSFDKDNFKGDNCKPLVQVGAKALMAAGFAPKELKDALDKHKKKNIFEILQLKGELKLTSLRTLFAKDAGAIVPRAAGPIQKLLEDDAFTKAFREHINKCYDDAVKAVAEDNKNKQKTLTEEEKKKQEEAAAAVAAAAAAAEQKKKKDAAEAEEKKKQQIAAEEEKKKAAQQNVQGHESEEESSEDSYRPQFNEKGSVDYLDSRTGKRVFKAEYDAKKYDFWSFLVENRDLKNQPYYVEIKAEAEDGDAPQFLELTYGYFIAANDRGYCSKSAVGLIFLKEYEMLLENGRISQKVYDVKGDCLWLLTQEEVESLNEIIECEKKKNLFVFRQLKRDGEGKQYAHEAKNIAAVPGAGDKTSNPKLLVIGGQIWKIRNGVQETQSLLKENATNAAEFAQTLSAYVIDVKKDGEAPGKDFYILNCKVGVGVFKTAIEAVLKGGHVMGEVLEYMVNKTNGMYEKHTVAVAIFAEAVAASVKAFTPDNTPTTAKERHLAYERMEEGLMIVGDFMKRTDTFVPALVNITAALIALDCYILEYGSQGHSPEMGEKMGKFFRAWYVYVKKLHAGESVGMPTLIGNMLKAQALPNEDGDAFDAGAEIWRKIFSQAAPEWNGRLGGFHLDQFKASRVLPQNGQAVMHRKKAAASTNNSGGGSGNNHNNNNNNNNNNTNNLGGGYRGGYRGGYGVRGGFVHRGGFNGRGRGLGGRGFGGGGGFGRGGQGGGQAQGGRGGGGQAAPTQQAGVVRQAAQPAPVAAPPPPPAPVNIGSAPLAAGGGGNNGGGNGGAAPSTTP